MKKRALFSLLAVLLITLIFALPIANSKYTDRDKDISDSSDVSKAPNVIVKPPQKQETKPRETIAKNDEKVVFIVELTGEPLIDTVINSNGKYKNIPELVLTNDGKVCCDTIKKNQAIVKASIQKLITDSDFSESSVYYALINGFSVKAPMSAKEKIAKINGVKNVMISDTFFYDQDISGYPADISDISVGELELLNHAPEFDGSNTLVAVIDSEFNVSHEAFSVEPNVRKYNSSDIDNIYRAVNFSVSSKYRPENIFKNNKIVYSYDYYENDTDTYSKDSPCHGTHIAALIGGNNGKDDENAFRGIACNCQLALMKVSGRNMTASSHTVLSALDDCAKLGADVINISLAGDYPDNIGLSRSFEKLMRTGVMIVSPCGNYASAEAVETYDIDHGKLNVLCGNTFSVASSANDKIRAEYISVDGNYFYYSDIYSEEDDLMFGDIAEDENGYIYLSADDEGKFDYSLTQDKTAIVEREGYDWEEHARQAFFAGARALAVIDSGGFQDNAYNNISTIEKEYIPIIFLDDRYTGYFEENPEGVLDIGEEAVLIDSDNGNTMSVYSSWGITDDLKLKPEITTVGENVLSAESEGEYKYMSGTSVSAALVSGAYAVVRQYLSEFEWFVDMSPEEQSETIVSVIMSNAEPVKEYSYEDDELLYISPRKQGAGRVDIESVTVSGAYLEVTDSSTPAANIGDGMTGKYDFSFKIKNTSSQQQTFSANYFIQTDRPEISDDKIINTLEPYSLKNIATVRLTSNGEEFEEITAEPFGECEINVEIELEQAEEFMKAYFPNGFYIDGFIVLENDAGRTLNLPFMGFFGEWGNINPFYSFDKNNAPYFEAADYNAVAEPVHLGKNLSVSKNTVGNYYSVSNLKNAYIIPDMRIIRDCFDFTVTVYDKNKKLLFSKNYGHIIKDKTIYEQIASDSREIAEFFSNLADGEYIYTVSARTMTSDGTVSQNTYSAEHEFSVDSQKPQIVSAKTYQSDENIYLSVTAKDNVSVEGFEFYTAAYNNKTKKYDYADKLDDLISNGFISPDACFAEENIQESDGSVSYIYNITSLYSELTKLQFMTRTSISPFSALKIAYRAYDGAYNFTEIKIADAVAYKKAVFELKDQNKKPVKDVEISLGNRTAFSDEKGMVVFDGLLPDVYLAEILSVPENYSVTEKYFVINISYDDNVQEISFDFSGEYPETPQESSEPSLDVSELQQDMTDNQNSEIDSSYAVLFVGILLLVSAVSLVVSRKRRN